MVPNFNILFIQVLFELCEDKGGKTTMFGIMSEMGRPICHDFVSVSSGIQYEQT